MKATTETRIDERKSVHRHSPACWDWLNLNFSANFAAVLRVPARAASESARPSPKKASIRAKIIADKMPDAS